MQLTTEQKIQIAKVLSVSVRTVSRLFGRSSDVVQVRRGDVNWRLDLREGVDLSIYLLGAFERRTVAAYSWIVKEGDVVFDIGANIGAHTLPLAKLVGARGHVYAFEPTAFAYEKLRGNIAINPNLSPRITAHQAMLQARDDAVLKAGIHSSWPLTGGEERHAQHQGVLKSTEGASSFTLDRFMSQPNGPAKVNFVKLDVDGHEGEVLSGWTTIEKYMPSIVLELGAYEEHTRPLADILSDLARRGYKFFKLNQRNRGAAIDPIKLVKSLPPGTGCNFLAVPDAQMPAV